MLDVWFPLAAIGLGHLCLTILLLNWSHGLGFAERRMHHFTVGLACAFAGTTAVAVWALPGTAWRSWPGLVQAYAALCLGVACVGLPVATLLRRRRRPPGGVWGHAVEADLAAYLGRDALVGSTRKSWMLRLPGNESLRLQFNEWTVERADLPAALDGLTILHLTDLHLASTYDRRYFEAVADAAAGREADLVLFTGDLVDDEAAVSWIAPVLSRLRGRLGSYAILGNHDYQYDTGRLCGELEGAGFTMVEGVWTHADIEGIRLAIGGTSAPWGPALEPATMPGADARLLLSHTPDLLALAASWDVDLMFSGHNHGGQVRLPVVGPVLMPSRFSRRYDHGFFRLGRTVLYVSRGVGAKHPIRYGCLPEIARFTLRVAPAARARRGRRGSNLASPLRMDSARPQESSARFQDV